MRKNYKPIVREELSPATVTFFQKLIYRYYMMHGRSFPWRNTYNPYHILASEIMLQQTQTTRVESKYPEFISEFPDFRSLAHSPIDRVLRVWKGLGYNRRALALREIAHIVVTRYDDVLPGNPDELIKLPGIGRYTAAAVAAFAFGQPTVLIDTNIRAVFLYMFFHEKENVADREILPLIDKTLDRTNPRKWYYALFDYGAMLKRGNNVNTRSIHYRKQKPFRGSNREIRGNIIGMLLDNSSLSCSDIARCLKVSPAIVQENAVRLQKEGFILVEKDCLRLYDFNRFDGYK